MMKKTVSIAMFATFIFPFADASRASEVYGERYRPQFHFSPRKGWIGDPNGLFRYHGDYHLFWWGHAVSKDFVHWEELPFPMTGDDGSFNYFSGSVVVDTRNTSGFGSIEQPPMVAIYTANRKSDHKDDQRISYSTDERTFRYHTANPIIGALNPAERDPDVFWHAATSRWIMTTSVPEHHCIRLQSSTDLKSWKYLSTFGPLGARSENWEVACLFKLPIAGRDERWVMLCGMGPNKEQYFTGSFDGTEFHPDAETLAYLTTGKGMPSRALFDFETSSADTWHCDGPSAAVESAVGRTSGALGNRLMTFRGGAGKALSPSFVIEGNAVNLLAGGSGLGNEAHCSLIVDGRSVAACDIPDTRQLRWIGIDASQWRGREARVEISKAGADSEIDIDHVTLSETLWNTGREHAKWLDWGDDFYALRAIRDLDHDGTVHSWIAWMGNWKYANRVPASWGRGALSIPRAIRLEKAAEGPILVQSPLSALQGLRGEAIRVDAMDITGSVALDRIKLARNVYELEGSFSCDPSGSGFTLDLCCGGSQKTGLSYNPRISNVTLDRSVSGETAFSSEFGKSASAPLKPSNGRVKFHLFVDQSSIEIFVNDGEAVLTSLIYPDPGNREVRVTSGDGCRLEDLTVWPMKSIWESATSTPLKP